MSFAAIKWFRSDDLAALLVGYIVMFQVVATRQPTVKFGFCITAYRCKMPDTRFVACNHWISKGGISTHVMSLTRWVYRNIKIL